MSSEIAAICASNEGNVFKLILFLNFFKPIKLLTFSRLSIGQLCFSNPSIVSNVKFNPLNFKYLFSKNITIRNVCKL